MEVLLDVINDLADITRRNVGIQSMARGRFDDRFIMSRADGGVDVRTKQRHDPSLVLAGYSAQCLALLALNGTRLTRRHALVHDQMIAAEEAAAQDTQAPAGRGGFAATCRTLEFKWNREHLLALFQESRQNRVDDVS
jgi:hypothetical protein